MAGAVHSEVHDVGLVLGPNRALGEPRSLALAAGPPAPGSSSASTADEAPEWIMVLPLGRVEGDPDLVEVRDWRPDFRCSDPDRLVEEFNDRVERDGPVVIDRNHAELWSWFGKETPAAGWLTKAELREDGIYGRSAWTPRGAQEVTEREYGYTSPVVSMQWAVTSEGERDYETPPAVGRIAGLSIVNSPATYTKCLTTLRQQPEAYMAGFGLAPFSSLAAADLRATAARLTQTDQPKKAVAGGARGGKPTAAALSTRPSPSQEAPMSTPKLPPAAQAALEKLGLSAESSPQDVEAAITQLSSIPGEAVAALTQKVELLATNAEAKQADERNTRIETALSSALSSGRLTPGAIEVYREIGLTNGPELLERTLLALSPTPLDQREGQLELANDRAKTPGDDVATFATEWGLTPDEMQAAVARRDELPEPRLLDPATAGYGEAIKAGA